MQSDRGHILAIISKYLRIFPDETDRLSDFIRYLKTTQHDIRSRKNMDGHLTGSALIVDITTGRLLLIHHRSLNRLLQPGGHVNPGESPMSAALREAIEEVGEHAYQLHSIDADPDIPVDFDAHLIPANPKKQEGEHYHFDFRYILKVRGSDWVRTQQAEVVDHQWIGIDELAMTNQISGLRLALHKLQRENGPQQASI